MQPSNALEKLRHATQELAEVRDARDAKSLMDKASAAKHYAMKAQLGQDAIDYAHAIKVDAERLLGGFLKAGVRHQGGRPDKNGTNGEPFIPAGISKKVSARAQKVHAIAETHPEQFEAVRANKLSFNKAKRIVAEQDRAEELKEAKRSTSKRPPGIDIRVADAFCLLGGLAPASVDCILTDPPYNVTEYDWDKHPSPSDYLAFIARLLTACKRVLKPEAYQLFLFCDAEYMARIESLIVAEGFPIKSRLIWVRKNMSMGRVVKDRFISQWEPVFHCGTRPLNLPAKWGSERGDVQKFAVPQTNFSDRKIHPTQKPLALVQRLIELGSDPGQLIVDPFCGGGTTAVACHILKRECITCDTNADYVALAKARIHGQL